MALREEPFGKKGEEPYDSHGALRGGGVLAGMNRPAAGREEDRGALRFAWHPFGGAHNGLALHRADGEAGPVQGCHG